MSAVVVLSTFPNEEVAASVAKVLLEESLIACVNIVPKIRSMYLWEGKLCDEHEVLCLFKSNQHSVPSLKTRIAENHPYDCPEILILDVSNGHPPYLDWLEKSLQ